MPPLTQEDLQQITAALKGLIQEAVGAELTRLKRAAKQSRRADLNNPVKSAYQRFVSEGGFYANYSKPANRRRQENRSGEPSRPRASFTELESRVDSLERYQRERKASDSALAAQIAAQVVQARRHAGKPITFDKAHAEVLAELSVDPRGVRVKYQREIERATESDRTRYAASAAKRPDSATELGAVLAERRTGVKVGERFESELRSIFDDFAAWFSAKLEGHTMVGKFRQEEQPIAQKMYVAMATEIAELAKAKAKELGRPFNACHLEASREVHARRNREISDVVLGGAVEGGTDWTRRPLIAR